MGIKRYAFTEAGMSSFGSNETTGAWVAYAAHEQVVADLRAELAAKSKDAETLMDAVRKHGHSMANSEILERLGEMGEGNGR